MITQCPSPPKDDVDKHWPGNQSWQLLCKFWPMFYGRAKVMPARYLKTQIFQLLQNISPRSQGGEKHLKCPFDVTLHFK